MLDRIDELEAENESLQDQNDPISDIVKGEDKGYERSGKASLRAGWHKETD